MIDLELKAISLFGKTNDLYETAYILQDGTMLNFSSVNMDATNIESLFDCKKGMGAILEFMRITGALRINIDLHSNYTKIYITNTIKISQVQQRLLEFASRLTDEVCFEYYGNTLSNSPTSNRTLHTPTPQEVVKTLDSFENKINVDIKLESKQYKIIRVKNKTTAKGFKEMKQGDIIQFSTVIEKRRSGYSVDVKVKNLSKPGKSVSKTIVEIPKFIKNLVLEEVY